MKQIIKPTFLALALILLGAGSMAAQSSSVDGEWDARINTPAGARNGKLILKVDGQKLTGEWKATSGSRPIKGTAEGKEINFSYTVTFNDNDMQITMSGTVDGDAIRGSVNYGGLAQYEWSAKRVPPAQPKP